MKKSRRCQFVRKNGKQCRNKAKKGHFCSRHSTKKLGKVAEKLLKAGKVATAAVAILKLVDVIIAEYPKLKSVIHELWGGLMATFPQAPSENMRKGLKKIAKNKGGPKRVRRGILKNYLRLLKKKLRKRDIKI